MNARTFDELLDADIARWLPMLSSEDASIGYYIGSMLLGNFV